MNDRIFGYHFKSILHSSYIMHVPIVLVAFVKQCRSCSEYLLYIDMYVLQDALHRDITIHLRLTQYVAVEMLFKQPWVSLVPERQSDASPLQIHPMHNTR